MDDVRRLPVGERIERDSEEIRVILDDLAREGCSADDRRGAGG